MLRRWTHFRPGKRQSLQSWHQQSATSPKRAASTRRSRISWIASTVTIHFSLPARAQGESASSSNRLLHREGRPKKRSAPRVQEYRTRIPSHVSAFAINYRQSLVSRSIDSTQTSLLRPFPSLTSVYNGHADILPNSARFMPLCREANGSSSVTSGPIQGKSYLPSKASTAPKGGY